MDQQFVDYFKNTEQRIRNKEDLPWLVSAIDDSVEELQRRELTLRSDAFVFLFLNLEKMVWAPWTASQGADADVNVIGDRIRTDLRIVMRLAAWSASQANEVEVSANSVFQAIAQLQHVLSIRVEEFWGP